jgi:hypothetical protein
VGDAVTETVLVPAELPALIVSVANAAFAFVSVPVKLIAV